MTPAPVARPMRPLRRTRPIVVLALATSVALLSGCAVPTDEPEADPLFGLCPQWAQGPGEEELDVALSADGGTGNSSASGSGASVNGSASQDVALASANATHDGRPLDLYRILVDGLDVDGRLELRAFAADGRQLGIRDYRLTGTQIVPVVAFTDGSGAGHEFDVFLSPVAHDGQPSPAPVTLRWTATQGSATVEGSVTFHYKVCGAEI
jgi:hypothetical protein